MRTRIISIATLFALLGAALVVTGQPPVPASRPYLGILAEPAPAGAERPGVFAREVTPGSPAEKAGLKPGDEIFKVGDNEVRDFDDLVNVLAKHKPGDKLDFRVRRDGKERNLTVTLGERQPLRADRPVPARPTAFLGVATAPLTAAEKSRLGVTADGGAVVMEVAPDTPAARAGLKRDDVITACNDKPITSPEQVRRVVNETGAGKEITFTVLRGKETKHLKARLEEAPADAFGPPAIEDANPLRRMERRLDRLEKRVQELENKLNQRSAR
jgi:S1-C subfamily serine protease